MSQTIIVIVAVVGTLMLAMLISEWLIRRDRASEQD
jgi:hypothetical protein